MTIGRKHGSCNKTFIGVLALLTAAVLLPACGGGGGGSGGVPALPPQAELRENPGQGVNSGVVMGKGSIIVNAVAFSVADPTIRIDGAGATEAQVVEGMVVTMRGSFGPLEPQGTATAVEVEPQLIGRVDSVGAGTATVLGQTVQITNFTIFDSTNANRTLVVGDIVNVHGFFTDFGTPHVIEATFISRRAANDPKRQIRGVVAAAAPTGFTIGGQVVNNISQLNPIDNDFVEVEGTGGDAGTAVTTDANRGVTLVPNFGAGAQTNDEFEIEGSVESHNAADNSFVLRTPSGRATVRYHVPGFLVPTVFQREERNLSDNSAILDTPDAQVEVEGRLVFVGQVPVLQAREIELKRLENVVLEGDVASVVGSNFTLAPFGVTYAAPAGQVPSAGQHVEVGGNVTPPGASLDNVTLDNVTVTRVTVLPASANRFLQGPVSATSGDGGTAATDSITILGITVDTTGRQDRDDPVLGIPSDFQNAANFRITKTKFFSLLRNNITVVKVKAARNANTGVEPFRPGPPATFVPNRLEIEEHR